MSKPKTEQQALKADRSVAGLAALADYLTDQGDDDRAYWTRVERNLLVWVRRGLQIAPVKVRMSGPVYQKEKIALGDGVTVVINPTVCEVRVDVYVDGTVVQTRLHVGVRRFDQEGVAVEESHCAKKVSLEVWHFQRMIQRMRHDAAGYSGRPTHEREAAGREATFLQRIVDAVAGAR